MNEAVEHLCLGDQTTQVQYEERCEAGTCAESHRQPIRLWSYLEIESERLLDRRRKLRNRRIYHKFISGKALLKLTSELFENIDDFRYALR